LLAANLVARPQVYSSSTAIKINSRTRRAAAQQQIIAVNRMRRRLSFSAAVDQWLKRLATTPHAFIRTAGRFPHRFAAACFTHRLVTPQRALLIIFI
jgi:hypothetical protein